MSNHGPNSSTSHTVDLLKKRNSSVPTSARTKTVTTNSLSLLVSRQKCVFCPKNSSKDSSARFPMMINKALYSKYSSSQNYYYTKDINEILTNSKTAKVIRFKDSQHFDEEEEYLKRFYKYSEYNNKIKMLTEYYKFHKDISRMFMKPITDVLNRYHDKKRKIEYIRVTKMLKEQNKEQSPTHKQEKPKKEEVKNVTITDKVLADLEITKAEGKYIPESGENPRIPDGYSNASTPYTEKGGDTRKIPRKEPMRIDHRTKGVQNFTSKQRQKTVETAHDQTQEISVSNTMQDLNMKLGEIINKSYSQAANLEAPSYFDFKDFPNETPSNLNKFLNFMKVNRQTSNLYNIPEITIPKPKEDKTKNRSNSRSQTTRLSHGDFRPASKERRERSDMFNDYPQTNRPEITKHTERGLYDTENILTVVQPDQSRRKSRKLDFTDEDGRPRISERPITSSGVERVPASSMSSTITTKSRNVPASAMKIKDFEDAFKVRQQGSVFKINSQRATSRDQGQQRTSLNSSRRTSDNNKVIIYQEDQKPTMRRRGSSNANHEDLSKSSFRGTVRDRSIHTIKNMNSMLESDAPNMNYPNMNGAPGTHKDMRITVDINSVSKNHQASSNNSSNITNTGKAHSIASQVKLNSGTMNNYGVKIISQKAMSSNVVLPTNKEIKSLVTSGQIEIGQKSLPNTASKYDNMRQQLSSRERSNSNHRNLAPEVAVMNLKNNAEHFYGKNMIHRENRELRNSSQHKLTKSEERLSKLDAALAKKSGLPYAKGYRNYEQIKHEVAREETRPVYTYNNNNVVNIFMHPHNEKVGEEATNIVIKKESQRLSTGSNDPSSMGTTIKFTNQKFSSDEGLVKLSQRKPSPIYGESKRSGISESPIRVVKKEDLRMTKSKSGTYANFGGISNTPLKLRDKYL